jgi:hypothetical protein
MDGDWRVTSTGEALIGIPIVTAPDWACDTDRVAWLRLQVKLFGGVRRLIRRGLR